MSFTPYKKCAKSVFNVFNLSSLSKNTFPPWNCLFMHTTLLHTDGDWEQLWGRIFTHVLFSTHILLVIGGGLKLGVLWFFVRNTIFCLTVRINTEMWRYPGRLRNISGISNPPKSYLAVRFPQGPFGFEKFRWWVMYYSQRPQRRLPRWDWKIEKSKFHQINHFPFLDQYWRAIDELTTQEEICILNLKKKCFFSGCCPALSYWSL